MRRRQVRAAAGDLFESLQHLKERPDETVVLPGHFDDEDVRPLATTLGYLEADNDLIALDDSEAFVETDLEGLSEEPATCNQIKAINWGQGPADRRRRGAGTRAEQLRGELPGRDGRPAAAS